MNAACSFSNFQLSSFVALCPTYSCYSLTWMKTDTVFGSCNPSALSVAVICVPGWFSAHQDCTEWLFGLLQPLKKQNKQKYSHHQAHKLPLTGWLALSEILKPAQNVTIKMTKYT